MMFDKKEQIVEVGLIDFQGYWLIEVHGNPSWRGFFFCLSRVLFLIRLYICIVFTFGGYTVVWVLSIVISSSILGFLKSWCFLCFHGFWMFLILETHYLGKNKLDKLELVEFISLSVKGFCFVPYSNL